MTRKRAELLKSERRVQLHLGPSVEGVWENVIRPWFESVSKASPAEGENVVVTPFRSQAYFLRGKLLKHGISLLGVKFLSPAQLRETLLRGDSRNIPLREHLRLLLALTAEKASSTSGNNKVDSESLIAKSVARDPDHFLRAIDQLSAAGWTSNEIREPALRKIAQEFENLTHNCGFDFVHEADRTALVAGEILPGCFNHFLIFGFDGAHWPLWPLLRTAAVSAANTCVVLNDPRDEARDLDETWVGTWEETFGPAEPIADAETSHSALRELNQVPESLSQKTSRANNPVAGIHFLVGRDTVDQAKAIVALTAKFLRDEKSGRIGILFPRSGALPRVVARFLESARIPHNDGIAHLSPSVFDDDSWQAWLELQQNPRLKFLLKFLHATPAQKFEGLSILQVEDVLRRAYADVLIDNIEILREYCARQAGSDKHLPIGRGLEGIQFLPARATLGEFLSQTRQIFSHLGWKQHWSEVDRLSRTWSDRVPGTFSKNNYLRWLREILTAPSLSRGDYGAHNYARVHLLLYDEGENQSWSHLIFAGSNEEAWPTLDDEFGFIRDQEIDEFNRQNKILNRRAVQRGSQGEGQWSVRENKTLLLGATERRQIRRRQLHNLVDSATQGIGVTANLYSESFPSRIANPSELFSRLYFSARGGGVSQRTLQALEEQTRTWLQDWSPVDAQKIDSINLGRTRYAFDARRQLRPSGEYDFALRTPPERPVALRVTEWEQALRWPALIWMKVFLGTEADDEDGSAWAIATGQWVHRWLAQGAGSSDDKAFVEVPVTEQVRSIILESARQFRAQIEALCSACGQALPDWWTSGWANALYIADCLAGKLAGLSDWSHMASEWNLDSPTTISLGDNKALRVRGRVDLILGRGERNDSRLGFGDLWIVDYKTGRQRGFNLRELRRSESAEEKLRKQLIDGRGVQLALYALAAHSLGAANARLTLLAPVGELEPQFHLEDALAQKEFWRALHQMQDSGVFGMLGRVHSDFGISRAYPLATLAIDPDFLREKWALTHPPLAIETEDIERE